MTRPRFEVADVLRRYGAVFRETQGDRLSLDQRRVMAAIEACRTAALGGHVDECDRCGHRHISYNSCRNRHCPKCQSLAKADWLDARLAELLPIPYFHVVFTVPAAIGPIALGNKRFLYDILFRATTETLKTIASDPKHLGAEIGGLAVLHTWGQNLLHHPHIHCIVTGGGFSPDRERWIPSRPGFFLSVRVLSRLFRRLFLEHLVRGVANGKLRFGGSIAELAEPMRFRQLIEDLRRMKWVVYAKRPFGGPRQVLDYLGRYTHRVAISNHRIVGIDDGRVRFLWKDYAHGNQRGVLSLDANEFLRRFLLHVLPRRFVRIRHFGFLANRRRRQNIHLAPRLLASAVTSRDSDAPSSPTGAGSTADDLRTQLSACPVCRDGHLVRIELLPPAAGERP
ncbi:MAG TPA: IS91 family transposase, partial [Thermoanaerobaculia bacterium]